MPTLIEDFDISFGADGSQFLTGIIEIDEKSKSVHKHISTSSQPLPLEFFEDAVALIRQVSNLIIKYKGIKTISFKQKV